MLVPFLLQAVSLSAQDAGRYQFDDIIYALPKGWKKGKTKSNHVDIYSSENGVASIKIFRSEVKPRSVESWIAAKMKLVLDDKDRITKDLDDRKLKIGTSTAFVSGRVVGKKVLLGYTLVGKKKTNIVIMKTRIARSGKAEQAFKDKLQKEFLPFVLKLKYVSQGATPVLGAPVSGNLSGTFTGLKYAYGIDLTTKLDQEFYTFSKSGRFIRGLPKGTSLRNIDFGKAIRQFPDIAGNYRVERGKIYFEYADGVKKSRKFNKTKTGFKIGQTYTPVKMIADGAELDGFFNDLTYSSFTTGSIVKGGVVQTRSFRFEKSGEFTATKFSGAFGNFENSVGDSSGGFSSKNSHPKIVGRYEVKDGALKLKDDSGKISVCSIVQLGDRLLYIDGVQYLKTDSTNNGKE